MPGSRGHRKGPRLGPEKLTLNLTQSSILDLVTISVFAYQVTRCTFLSTYRVLEEE